MSALPKVSLRKAALLTFAAVCVLVVSDAGREAVAQGRMEAEYTATISGIPIGRGSFVVDISDEQFSATVTGATTGLLQFLVGARGAGTTHGVMSGGQLVPTSYASTVNNDRKIDDVRMVFAGGNVKDYRADPPPTPHPLRVPVSEADRHGVVDPITSAINRVAGTGEPVSPQACGRTVAVFDGRLRFDLHSEFKRIEMVKAERGYQGPAVVCAVYFRPISGYIPDRPVIKYLAELRDAEVWMVPLSGTRMLVPFRFTMPTPIGHGVLQATQFFSAPQAPHTTANVKTQ